MAVETVKTKIYPGSWKGTRVKLHLDIEEGLKLYTSDDKVIHSLSFIVLLCLSKSLLINVNLVFRVFKLDPNRNLIPDSNPTLEKRLTPTLTLNLTSMKRYLLILIYVSLYV
jgi:hypothetical protein